LVKIANLNLPHLNLSPPLEGDSVGISSRSLA